MHWIQTASFRPEAHSHAAQLNVRLRSSLGVRMAGAGAAGWAWLREKRNKQTDRTAGALSCLSRAGPGLASSGLRFEPQDSPSRALGELGSKEREIFPEARLIPWAKTGTD